MQFRSDQYDDLLKSGTSLEEEIGKLSRKLHSLAKDVDRIDKAIDDILSYSYQYNLKIVGVPQIKENESAYETTNLCLKNFSALGNDILALEILILHIIGVQQRGAVTNNGRPTRPNPIVCKFTRRLTRDTVLASRSNFGQLIAEALGLPPTFMVNRILIFPHLTPRLQDLLRAAREHQNTYNYKWFWAKETGIFLRKTDTSGVIRLKSINDLRNLRMRESSQLRSD